VDSLTPFLFESNLAHGAVVQVEQGVAEMLRHRSFSPDVTRLIGEAMAAMPLLATHMRFEGRINLQFRGEGPMKLLVAQVDHELSVRGMAQAPEDLSGSFEQMLYGGILALMLEPSGQHQQASQALVLIQGERLEQALEAYFDQSEQLPTLVRLAFDGERIAGFLLQRLPSKLEVADDDEWNRLRLLAATLTPQELSSTDPLKLLTQLFAEDPLRVFAPRAVNVRCRCNRTGIERLILSLGRAEADDIVREQGEVAVTCEFCGRNYRFSAQDVDGLFAGAPALSIRKH
jgi:molecular chaperone Hsp33